MAKENKPRCGSLGFYPRKRAKRETPAFKTFRDKNASEARPLNFYGYKVGMTHAMGVNKHKGSALYGQKVARAVTVIETPPLFIYGIRAYKKTSDGLKALKDVLAENIPEELSRRIKTLARRKKKASIEEIEKLVKEGKVCELRLLACTQPKLTTIGKKKPEAVEIHLSGDVEKQLSYAKEKLGKELTISEVFKEKEWLDVKAVTKGKGFQGVVKRFGVTMQRPKAKKRRVVGSIGPWTPATVMWTVPRPGQMGYHTRTEYNKMLLKIGKADLNPSGGWKNYGIIKNDYIVVDGSVPGPSKRCIALRHAIRPPAKQYDIEEVEVVAA